MHKKRAQFSLFCTPTKPCNRPEQYMKGKCAHTGAPPLTYRCSLKSCSISWERLVSVDANSRLGGFLPAAPKFHGFGICLPPQNAAYYTTTRRQKTNPRQKSSARATARRQCIKLSFAFSSRCFLSRPLSAPASCSILHMSCHHVSRETLSGILFPTSQQRFYCLRKTTGRIRHNSRPPSSDE